MGYSTAMEGIFQALLTPRAHASKHCRKNMARLLREAMSRTDDIKDALVDSYAQLDQVRGETYSADMQLWLDLAFAKPDHLMIDGSTCLTVYVTNGFIYCANAGDSRCIIGSRDGEVHQMSRDHKPGRVFPNKQVTKGRKSGF